MSSAKSKTFGIISVIVGVLIIVILVPNVISMAEYRGDSTQVTIFYLVINIMWGITFIVAGLSILFFKTLSFILYIGALAITLFQYIITILTSIRLNKDASIMGIVVAIVMASIVFFAIPIIMSVIGINISRRYHKSNK